MPACCSPNLQGGLDAAYRDICVFGIIAQVMPYLIDGSAVCEMHHKVHDGGERRAPAVAMNGRRRVISTLAGR